MQTEVHGKKADNIAVVVSWVSEYVFEVVCRSLLFYFSAASYSKNDVLIVTNLDGKVKICSEK